LILAGFALLLIVPISVLLGVLAALNYGGAADRIITIAGLSFVALPEFVVGTFVIVIFAVHLGWFPVSSSVPDANPVDIFQQLLLPSIPLMFVLFGYISRMARVGTVESLRSNYTRTAVLKGLPQRQVVGRHVLRNSLLPTITVVSVQVGYLVGGLVVVETLFSYPGIGQLILNAAVSHDLPVLEPAVLMIAIIYLVANFIADVLVAVLNPRVRLAT
jgi:peptide/nickel transport system permease protein